MVDTTATLATDYSPAGGATASWSVWKTSEKLMICNCNAILVDYFLYILTVSLRIILCSRISKFCVDALDTAGWSVC